MKLSMTDILFALSDALDCVEHELLGVTTYHAKRVAYLSACMGKQMGLTKEEQTDLAGLSILHDNALTEYIYEEYQNQNYDSIHKGVIDLAPHCIQGEENIRKIPFYGDTRAGVYYHHENADGSGPFHKTWKEISVYARIIHLADTLDAAFDLSHITESKVEKIQEWLKISEGSLFDKEVIHAVFPFICFDYISKMNNEKINLLLQETFPNEVRDYTSDQIIDFASIFAAIIDYKSQFTRRHSIGIAEKAYEMAKYYGYTEEKMAMLYLAGALHDIGKLVVDKDILEKPDRLTSGEYQHIQTHAYATFSILSQIRGMEELTKWAAYHHEKLDGSGYPFGLMAKDLNQEERLLACLDIYQALREDRPYKKGMDQKETMQILEDMGKRGLLDSSIIQNLWNLKE